MTSFGKQVSPGMAGSGARASFGKKAAPQPYGNARSVPAAKLSPQAAAFLDSERKRAPQVSTPAYAVPVSEVGHMAGKPVWGRRVVATFIDALVFIVPLVAIVSAIGPQPQITGQQFDAVYFGGIFFLLLASLAYSIGMEASAFQATLGKMAVGAIVTNKQGGKPSLGAVIARNTIGKLVSGITPFYVSYLMGLTRQDRRCLHDLMAGTMVCAKSKAGVSYEQTFA